jgi:hypothetical protein
MGRAIAASVAMFTACTAFPGAPPLETPGDAGLVDARPGPPTDAGETCPLEPYVVPPYGNDCGRPLFNGAIPVAYVGGATDGRGALVTNKYLYFINLSPVRILRDDLADGMLIPACRQKPLALDGIVPTTFPGTFALFQDRVCFLDANKVRCLLDDGTAFTMGPEALGADFSTLHGITRIGSDLIVAASKGGPIPTHAFYGRSAPLELVKPNSGSSADAPWAVPLSETKWWFSAGAIVAYGGNDGTTYGVRTLREPASWGATVNTINGSNPRLSKSSTDGWISVAPAKTANLPSNGVVGITSKKVEFFAALSEGSDGTTPLETADSLVYGGETHVVARVTNVAEGTDVIDRVAGAAFPTVPSRVAEPLNVGSLNLRFLADSMVLVSGTRARCTAQSPPFVALLPALP